VSVRSNYMNFYPFDFINWVRVFFKSIVIQRLMNEIDEISLFINLD